MERTPAATAPPAVRVLIAGCGYVGCALAERLVRHGDTVWGVRRRPERLPAGVRPIAADLADPSTLSKLPAGLDHVVYAASPDDRTDAAYRATYVDGLRNLLNALRTHETPPRRVFLTSSTGVYSQTDGEWVDEDTPPEPTGFTGERLQEGERLILGGPIPATVIRLAGIYGPGRTRLIDQVRRGDAVCPPPPRWSNRIHRDDCAGVLHHLMRLPEPAPLYLGVDQEPAEMCTILRWLADRLGTHPPSVADPDSESGSGRRGSNKRCSSARLVGSGYRFAYPTFRDGFGALLTESA